ncbi:uncharacterized protein [Periplaneta americana]|uniref:uncharacterized protein isoform X2 n=1 Tax=Periplaneta americana TaxID=6978 RepID=UPI0037E770E2
MENRNNRCDKLIFQPIDKGADVVDQLKYCQNYFQHISNNISDSEKISLLYDNLRTFAEFPDLAPGLLSSLSYSHLAAAGSDTYRSCIKNMAVEDWILIFLDPVVMLLTDGREIISTEKQNLFNYWIPNTLKIFPQVLNILMERLIEASHQYGFENNIFSIFSLLKLGKKGGLFCNTWEEHFSLCSLTFDDFLNLLNFALEHSNEAVRAEGFAVVCTSSKTRVIPSAKEFELVQKFLLENVNIDSSSLRQAILNSFMLFLSRLKDSGLHELKTNGYKHNPEVTVEGLTIMERGKVGNYKVSNLEINCKEIAKLTPTLQFFEWLHNFLISNLEPGTNYQRKIVSLHLYKLVLACFNGASQKIEKSSRQRPKKMPQEGERLVQYALNLGKWHFKSDKSHKILLSSILDPTDDIRETAGLILVEFFDFRELSAEKSKPMLEFALHLCSSPLFYETESGALLMKVLGNWTYKMPEEKRDKVICKMVNVDVKRSVKKSRNQDSGSILPLANQDKLLAGLIYKPKVSNYQQGELKATKIELKENVATFEGLRVMELSECEKMGDYDLPRIFEGLSVIARDGSVGQQTVPPPDKTCSPSDMKDPRKNYISKDSEFESLSSSGWFDEAKVMPRDKVIGHRVVSRPADKTCFETNTAGSKEDCASHSFKKGNVESVAWFDRPGTFEKLTDNDQYSLFPTAEETHWGRTDSKGYNVRQKVNSYPLNYDNKENHSVYEEFISESWEDYFLEENDNKSSTGINVAERKIDDWRYQNLSSKEVQDADDDDHTEANNSQLQTSTVSLRSRRRSRRPRRKKLKNLVGRSGYSTRLHIENTAIDRDLPVEELGWSLWNQFSSSSIKATTFNSQISYSPVSSSSGYESPKSQQPTYHKDFFSSDQEIHTRSQDRSRSVSIGSDIFNSSKFSSFSGKSSAKGSVYGKSLSNQSEMNKTPYHGTAPLSLFLIMRAEEQLVSLKENIFQAACSGSPLHGTLTALTRIAAQSTGPEFGCMSEDEVNWILSLLENAISFLLDLLAAKSISKSDVAPSFAEMDEAIKSSIQESLCNLEIEEEEMQLSPAHQLVYNCVWLNLKACCNLASDLSCTTSTSAAILRRCGGLITTVLTRCRHKGAIESAGVALSNFVKNVTSDTNSECKKEGQIMLRQYLTEFMDLLMCGGIKGSVTRRSAGLSILIHRIVASDMQVGKPLLHMCVSHLLNVTRTPIQPGASSSSSIVIDLPQAQALHFLRILAQDSSLRQDMAQYISSLALVCFSTFSSPEWTIRNAALQLSGALIPKLVGQKKAQDEEGAVGSDISLEEFFNHFPDLTEFILKSLQKATQCQKSQILQQHTDLVPMLSLLAKVAVGVIAFMNVHLIEKIAQYRVCFLQLMSSPIYHVRKLAAKAYERFIPLADSCSTIMTSVENFEICVTNCNETEFIENKLNGILLSLKYLLRKIKYERRNIPEFDSKMLKINTTLKKAMSNINFWNSCTYFNKVLVLQLLEDDIATSEIAYFSSDEVLEQILDVHNALEKEEIIPSYKPGLFLWASKVIEVAVKKCCPNDLVTTWYNSYVLCNHSPDIVSAAFGSLKYRLQFDDKIDDVIKSSLFILILKIGLDVSEDSYYYTVFPLCEVILMLVGNTKLNCAVAFRELQQVSQWCLSDDSDKSDYSMIALPVTAGLLSQYFAIGHCTKLSHTVLQFISKVADCIKNRSDPIKFEEDFRYNAARALHLLAPLLPKMLSLAKKDKPVNTKEMLNVIETLLNVELTLLQDEDYDVRQEASKFVVTYFTEVNQVPGSVSWNPYSSLKKLVKPEVLLTMLPVSHAAEFLWKKLLYADELRDAELKYRSHSHTNYEVTSPFEHGARNIYSEETKLVDILGMSLIEVLKTANAKEKDRLRKLICSRLLNFKDDVTAVLSMLTTKEPCDISSLSDRAIYYIVAKKILYQSQVVSALGIKKYCDMESVLLQLREILNFP